MDKKFWREHHCYLQNNTSITRFFIHLLYPFFALLNELANFIIVYLLDTDQSYLNIVVFNIC